MARMLKARPGRCGKAALCQLQSNLITAETKERERDTVSKKKKTCSVIPQIIIFGLIRERQPHKKAIELQQQRMHAELIALKVNRHPSIHIYLHKPYNVVLLLQ